MGGGTHRPSLAKHSHQNQRCPGTDRGKVVERRQKLGLRPSTSSPWERVPLGAESHHFPAVRAEEDKAPPHTEWSPRLAHVDLGKLSLAVGADRHEIVAPHCSTRLLHRLSTHSYLLVANSFTVLIISPARSVCSSYPANPEQRVLLDDHRDLEAYFGKWRHKAPRSARA